MAVPVPTEERSFKHRQARGLARAVREPAGDSLDIFLVAQRRREAAQDAISGVPVGLLAPLHAKSILPSEEHYSRSMKATPHGEGAEVGSTKAHGEGGKRQQPIQDTNLTDAARDRLLEGPARRQREADRMALCRNFTLDRLVPPDPHARHLSIRCGFSPSVEAEEPHPEVTGRRHRPLLALPVRREAAPQPLSDPLVPPWLRGGDALQPLSVKCVFAPTVEPTPRRDIFPTNPSAIVARRAAPLWR
jgi:hypothetical protein